MRCLLSTDERLKWWRFSKSKSLVCDEFQSFGLLTEVKTLVTLASKGPQWRVVTLFRFTAGFWLSCWVNVRLSFGPFGLKLWILRLKSTQQKLKITFLTVKVCYEQWWVILSCKTFLLVWQPSASRLICINFQIQLLSPLALVSGWYLISRAKTFQ